MARPNKDKSRNQIAKEEAETELVTTQESKPLEKFSLDEHCPVQNAIGPKEKELPPCSEDYVRNMFPHPQCKVAHAYGIMKVSYLLKELALELYYCCPHNEHLRVALGELEDAYEGCIKAVKSVE